jgi:hypothetical protein
MGLLYRVKESALGDLGMSLNLGFRSVLAFWSA